MIVRAWRGYAVADKAPAYAHHLQQSVFPKLGGIAGHRGAYLLRRESEGRIEFLVLTMWDSMQAIQQFAGSTPEKAVVEPEAQAVLAAFDPTVSHYEVVLGPAG
jgi:heme-degrading monooxygenase HmoA